MLIFDAEIQNVIEDEINSNTYDTVYWMVALSSWNQYGQIELIREKN